jgi:hypothetical protein
MLSHYNWYLQEKENQTKQADLLFSANNRRLIQELKHTPDNRKKQNSLRYWAGKRLIKAGEWLKNNSQFREA